MFHIGYLGIDGHPKAFLLLQLLQAVGVVVVEIGVGISIFDGRIIDVGASPHVVFDKEIDAAELAA